MNGHSDIPGQAADLPLPCEGTGLTERTGRGHLWHSGNGHTYIDSVFATSLAEAVKFLSLVSAPTHPLLTQRPHCKRGSLLCQSPQACPPPECSHRGGHGNGGEESLLGTGVKFLGDKSYPWNAAFLAKTSSENEHVFRQSPLSLEKDFPNMKGWGFLFACRIKTVQKVRG